jgi:glycosyltransferase involved in cell wall biosynthesis
MKITILAENISSKPVRRAHRLAAAARTFAEVNLVGRVEREKNWVEPPQETWITPLRKRRFPKFYESFVELVEHADGDVLIAVKPHMATFGAALVAAEMRQVPVILDIDDLDTAFSPRSEWKTDPSITDLSRPGSMIYTSLLTKAAPAASAITVTSSALQRRFGGTIVPHGCSTEVFNPALTDREAARRDFGFTGPTILFHGIQRAHKGIEVLAEAVRTVPGATLAVTCRPKDLVGPEWRDYPLIRVPVVAHTSVPALLAAADIVAIPMLDTDSARHQVPMKLFDAMAMAKPIVASSVSDLPLVLQGCGRLVPPGDVDRLAEALTELVNNPEDASALGKCARLRCVEKYSMEKIGQLLFDVVDRVTS